MRSQNRKVKVTKSGSTLVGRAGCLGLLALGFALVNPMSCLPAFAEGEDAEGAGVPVAQSSLASSVQISFGEPVGVSSLTPIDADGASALYSVRATVDVSNSGGYIVYLGSSKAELTGKNSGATINGVTSSTNYEGMPVNSWGYAYSEGEMTGTTFSAMPANIRGVTLGGNNSTNIKTDSKTFTLSFAAHIGNDKPADTYENEVTMSVVSSPLEVTNDFGITTMQEMTSAICSAAVDEDGDGQISAQLEDVRDGKFYWVSKLADGKCWMTQNLALDLGIEWPDASLSDYEVANTKYKPVATATTATSATLNSSSTGTRSWNLGDYVITYPTISSNCGADKVILGGCPAQFTSITGKAPSADANFYASDGKTTTDKIYDAHYLVGNYYQWNAATAGTGGTITTGQASGSICPKNWKLPTSNNSNVGSFGGLINAGGIGSNVAKLTGEGYFFVRGGLVRQDDSLFDRAGHEGYYWSSTPYSVDFHTYLMGFSGSDVVYPTASAGIAPSFSLYRSYALSVRCIAR